MALLPLINGDLVEMTIYCKFDEQVSANVLCFVASSVTPGPTVQTVASAYDGAYGPIMKDWVCDAAEYLGVSVRNLTATVPEISAIAKANAGGGDSGNSLPRQLAGLISWRTSVGGPRGRGRTYLPFPGVDFLLNDHINAAGVAVMNDFGVQFVGPDVVVGDGGSVTLTGSIRHRGLFAPLSHVVQTFTESTQFATQRRRGFFGRPNGVPAGF